jgi:hypothetical protein
MTRGFVVLLLASGAAFAGDVKVRVQLEPAPLLWQFPANSHRRPPPATWVPRWAPPVWVVPTPVVVPVAPPPAAPMVVVFEAPPPPPPPEPEPEPAPAPPQVVVVHVAPEPVAPPPLPPPAVTVVSTTPGPDVYSWTDDDGVVHYSTRVPADAKKRAKKLK